MISTHSNRVRCMRKGGLDLTKCAMSVFDVAEKGQIQPSLECAIFIIAIVHIYIVGFWLPTTNRVCS